MNNIDIKKQYPYLEPLEIISSDDEFYKKTMKKCWSSTGGVFFDFPFSIGCIVDEDLYKSEKITAKKLLRDKILCMPGEYAYFTLRTESKYLLIYISLHNFKLNIEQLLDGFDDGFKILNNDQLIIFQRAEYHWEVVLCKLPEPL